MIGGRGVGAVYARARPTDMRKSFHTLAQLVESDMGRDPISGDAYLFVNKRRTLAKVLLWDGTGLCIFMKKLQQNRFAAPWQRTEDGVVVMTQAELSLFFEGSAFVFVAKLGRDDVEPKRVATRTLSVR